MSFERPQLPQAAPAPGAPDPSLQPPHLLQRAQLYLQTRGIRERAAKSEETLKKDTLAEIATPPEGEYIEEEGGHRVFMFPSPIPMGKKVVAGLRRQRRESKVIDPTRVEPLLLSLNLPLDGVFETKTIPAQTVTELNEDVLYAMLFDKKISQEQFDALFDVTETFAMVLVDG